MTSKRIEELKINITGGQIMSRVVAGARDTEPEIREIGVIVPKAINADGTISTEEIATEKLKVEPDPKRVTKIGDIVIKLSTPYSAALITEESAGCLVPSFCAILNSTDDEIETSYLLAFLNSERYKTQIKAKVAGSAMAMLSVGKIKDVVIPVPSKAKQEKIGNEFIDAQRRLRIAREIIKLTELRNDVVFNNMEVDNE